MKMVQSKEKTLPYFSKKNNFRFTTNLTFNNLYICKKNKQTSCAFQLYGIIFS